jgi:hypothetical protein
MSTVERVYLEDGRTAILKSALPPFTREADVLRHGAHNDVPVPNVLAASSLAGTHLAMLLEDLGPMPEEDAPISIGASVAVRVHACPPLDGLSRLDSAALACLPSRALDTLDALQAAGRWTDASYVRESLEHLQEVAQYRSYGTAIPPWGMCHSEFHPTSIHRGPRGVRVLDWARAFTGPGLLDLASWEDTPKPLDIDAIGRMITAYVAAGGEETATEKRGHLPAAYWAGGWHRMWVSAWYLEQSLRWIPKRENDARVQNTVRRHLTEAVQCLT